MNWGMRRARDLKATFGDSFGVRERRQEEGGYLAFVSRPWPLSLFVFSGRGSWQFRMTGRAEFESWLRS